MARPFNWTQRTEPLPIDFSHVSNFLALRDSLQSGLSPIQRPQPQFNITPAAPPIVGEVAPQPPQPIASDWKSGLSPSESWLIQRESGFNPTAKNPKSTAFGIWQGLLATRKKYLGGDYVTTDPVKQLGAFRSYVKDRYQTPENAVAFWKSHKWY